jgi:ketosteroid isomerase-like protein
VSPAGDPEVDLVRAIFRRFNEGDREPREDEWHEDAELVSPIADLRGGPYRGYAGIREWQRDVSEHFEDWTTEMGEVRAVGERVLALGKIRMTGRGSGLEIEQDFGWVFDMRDGRIARLQIVPDTAEAERLAGEG